VFGEVSELEKNLLELYQNQLSVQAAKHSARMKIQSLLTEEDREKFGTMFGDVLMSLELHKSLIVQIGKRVIEITLRNTSQ
jgi:hypothetical protein